MESGLGSSLFKKVSSILRFKKRKTQEFKKNYKIFIVGGSHLVVELQYTFVFSK